MQPEEILNALLIHDAQKTTPLHYPAIFDPPDIVEYLVEQVSLRLLYLAVVESALCVLSLSLLCNLRKY